MSRMGFVKSLLVTASVVGLHAICPSFASAQGQLGPPTQQEIEDSFQAANTLLEQGDYDEAIQQFSIIIQQTGEQSAAPFVGRAKAFEALQEYAAALKDYAAAIEADMPLMQDDAIVAVAYNGRGELRLQFTGGDATAVRDALDDFTKAVEYDRTNAEYLVNQAKALVQIVQPRQAVQVLTRALRLAENNAEAYRTSGLAYAQLQDFERAAADIAKATELEPDNHENHYSMGLIHMQAKEHQRAVEAFYRAKESYTPEDPENPVPYVEPFLASSLAYIELGKESDSPSVKQTAYVRAIEETEKALQEQPLLPFAYLNRGVALRLLGLYKDARDAFTQAIHMSPEFAEAYFRRGIVWYYMGDRELARKDFREAIAINYDDVRPYLWTGITLADEGKYHEAIIQYGNAINLNPRYVPAYINRGLAYAQLEEYERAEDSFAEAIRLEPAEATHYFKRGSVLMAMGRYDDALQAFSSAISNANYYVDAYRKAAEALRELGRAELAAQYVQQANEIEAAIRERLEELRRQAEQLGQAEDLPSGENVLTTGEEAVPEDGAADAPPGLEFAPIGPADAAPNPFQTPDDADLTPE